MSEKKPKQTAKSKDEKGYKVDPKWKKKPKEDQTMDGLGVSFEEAMKALANPQKKND